MIVCVCNRLCEQRCKEAACRSECRTVGCVYRALGCRVRCGKCLPFMQELFASARDDGADTEPTLLEAPRPAPG